MKDNNDAKDTITCFVYIIVAVLLLFLIWRIAVAENPEGVAEVANTCCVVPGTIVVTIACFMARRLIL